MPDWITPTVITALGVVVWYLARRIMDRLDTIHNYMMNEIRQFDVRLSVIETLVLPPETLSKIRKQQ